MIAEEASVSDEFIAIDAKSVSESLVMTDSDPLGRRFSYPSISESLVAADTANMAFSFTINDIIFMWDTLVHGWNFTLPKT